MSDENNLFDLEENEDRSPNYEDLVGEGKKYRDNDAVAKALIEKDRFIESLKREARLARQEVQERLNTDELVEKLQRRIASSTAVTPTVSESQPTPNPVVTPTKAEVDPDEIASIVKNTMTREQIRLQQEKNLNSVASTLKKTWGENWASKLLSVGSSLDLTKDQMDELAKTNPKVLLASVMKEHTKIENEKFVAPRSSILSSPSTPENDGWAAYEKLRKSNPREYYSQRVQMQLHKDVASGKVIPPSD